MNNTPNIDPASLNLGSADPADIIAGALQISRGHAIEMMRKALEDESLQEVSPAGLQEHTILAITTAYEQGVGKGRQAYESGKEIANPYNTSYRCDLAWQYGYEEGKEQAERLAEATPQQEEPVAWESTVPGYIKYVSQSKYEKFSPKVQRWYKPYKCSSCATPQALGEDTKRLDLLDKDAGKQVFSVGTTWYARSAWGRPHRKQKDLRAAIDTARGVNQSNKPQPDPQLLQAAPQLLQALKALLNQTNSFELAQAYDKARAAIAKAGGSHTMKSNLRSTTRTRLEQIHKARNTSVLDSAATTRVNDMRTRLAEALVRKGFSSYHALQYSWANDRP